MTAALITTIIVNVGLLFLFAWRELCHDKERRDLYSRLMAKDLTEYQHIAASGSRPPPKSGNVIRAGLTRYYQEHQHQESGE